MFVYEKKLQYPVKIKNPNPKLAAVIISQYGGPDGELGASLRYLSQRYSMPYAELKGLLTDIGTEELGHLEMVGAIVHQLTRNLSEEDIRTAGFDTYFVDHTTSVYPTAASGFPWSAGSIAVTGDMIADLTEDLAAEQKARLLGQISMLSPEAAADTEAAHRAIAAALAVGISFAVWHFDHTLAVVMCSIMCLLALYMHRENIGRLLARKHYYFVPFGQDDPLKKPASLIADFARIPQAMEGAMAGQQIQPMLL